MGLFKIEGGKTENLFRDKYSFVKAVELNGRIYFATKESYIIEYDLKKKSFTEIKNTIFNDAFSDIACLSDQDLLISTRSSGVISFNIDSKLFYKPDWAKDADLRGDIAYIVDGKKGIWMYNHTGIVWL